MATQPNPDCTLTGRHHQSAGRAAGGLSCSCLRPGPQDPGKPLSKYAVTDAEGRYKISFTEIDFKVGDMESGGPDGFIRVYDGDELLGESPVKRNSGKRSTIDLQVDYVKAVPNVRLFARLFAHVQSPMLFAEGGEK
jgi:hypothetical protein